ncbi:proteasome assembly chaperone 1-like [Ischnura elegans]|uniref:proteasome assembly chaperone 1-like n=1 Tax=Ischnura elegans TaxID=197161 RepID=UPI001ED8B6D2|nr:proteasome assembly chaperone 1-like [Ischnura elegans]XP_046403246.1 proteasome assembly chaperone 1-like [Ischnura elegans]
MASYFGEVLETSSRAYDGDSDDDTELNDALKRDYEISWITGDRPQDVQLFLIAVGKCCCAYSALLRQKSSPELIAKIVQVRPEDAKEETTSRFRKEEPSCIYRLKGGILLCEVSPDVQVIHANRFTSKIHELLLASKEVILLTSLTSNRYASWKALSPPFIKALPNSTHTIRKKEVLAPLLEAPNIVTGVAASVHIFCEIKKISGCLYICYTPKEDIDSAIFSSIQKLFIQVQSIKSSVVNLTYESKDVECFTQRAGNLYL